MNKSLWIYTIYLGNTEVQVMGTEHDYNDDATAGRLIGLFNIYDNDTIVATFPTNVLSGWSREKRMESK